MNVMLKFIFIWLASSDQIKELMISAIKRDKCPFSDGLNKKGKLITSDEFLYVISERKKKLLVK